MFRDFKDYRTHVNLNTNNARVQATPRAWRSRLSSQKLADAGDIIG